MAGLSADARLAVAHSGRLVVGFALILGEACEVVGGCQDHSKKTLSLQIYFSGLKINLSDGLEKR